MNILISNSGEKPIYEQITSQIKNLIIQGELAAGQALPSMRLLAKELRISVITTKRAYEELEREGFVQTVPGKGSFVAGRSSTAASRRCCPRRRSGPGPAASLWKSWKNCCGCSITANSAGERKESRWKTLWN